jgi:hypothetical protein
MRRIGYWFSVASAAVVVACGGGGTDAGAQPRVVGEYESVPPSAGPYRMDVVDTNGDRLPSYYQRGRTYVLGTVGERYRIRIANPSARRVEAIVSVDGLDAVDGKAAGYDKRGYLVPAYGEVTIDGFRTSLADVATFRFSSVRDSYAGRKGQARNVGVIGVAFFPERYRPSPPPYAAPPWPPYYDGYDDRAERRERAEPPASAPAPRSRSAAEAQEGKGKRDSGGASRSPSAPPRYVDRVDRPGLGTEFGERRWSQVEYAPFERENSRTPAWVQEYRYDDRDGLLALGLPVYPYPRYVREVRAREDAEPFPATRFAEPP